METNTSTDSSLGGQGSQEFGSMLGGGNGTGGSGGGAAGPGTSQGQTPQGGGLPSKSLAEIEGQTGQGDGQQQQGNGETQQQQGNGDQQQQQGITTQQQAATAATTSAQSHADIIKATADAVIAAQAARTPQTPQTATAPKDLTPEEFNKKYSVVQVTPQHIAAILDQDPVKAAATLNSVIQGSVKQAVLMALDLTDTRVAEVEGKFTPHINEWQNYRQQVTAREAEDRFFKSFPDLANEKETVMEMKDALLLRVREGQVKFASEQQAFQAVAEASRRVLKRVGAAPQQQAQTTGQQTSSRSMSAASSAGRSGTGQAAAKSPEEQIFGADFR